MKTTIGKKTVHRSSMAPVLLATILLSLLLSACGMALGATPEEAALRDLNNQKDRRAKQAIDPSSIKVLQSSPLGERTFVLVYYEGVDSNLGGAKMTCLNLYQMRKALLGMWAPTSANGSCESKVQVAGGQSDQPEPPPQPITIGGGRSGGDGRGDPGASMVSGQVNDPAVKAVKVTWLDGTSTQADVINASYIAARTGEVEMTKVEALDEKGNSVFTWQPQTAPGKQ